MVKKYIKSITASYVQVFMYRLYNFASNFVHNLKILFLIFLTKIVKKFSKKSIQVS